MRDYSNSRARSLLEFKVSAKSLRHCTIVPYNCHLGDGLRRFIATIGNETSPRRRFSLRDTIAFWKSDGQRIVALFNYGSEDCCGQKSIPSQLTILVALRVLGSGLTYSDVAELTSSVMSRSERRGSSQCSAEPSRKRWKVPNGQSR